MSPDTARQILGVAPDARGEEIERAYRRLVRRHHPDVGGDVAHFLRLCDAHRCLIALERTPPPSPTATTPWRRRRSRFAAGVRRIRGRRRVQ